MLLHFLRAGLSCTLLITVSFAKPAFLPTNDLTSSVIGPLTRTSLTSNAPIKVYCGTQNGTEGSAVDLEAIAHRACPVRLSKGISESLIRPSRPGPLYYVRIEKNKTSPEQACSRPTCMAALKAGVEQCRTNPTIIHTNGAAERSCGRISWAIVAPEDEHTFRAQLRKERDARKQALAAERIVKRCQSSKLSGPFPQRQICRAWCHEDCLCRKQFGSGGLEECTCPCRKD